MADIDIQRKGGARMWPWVIGVLVLLVLIWLVFEAFLAPPPEVERPPDEIVAPPTEPAPPVAVPGSVEAFTSFVEDTEAREEMGLEHEYTAEGIRRLSAALGALVDRDAPGVVEIEEKRSRLQQRSSAIQQDPFATDHAHHVHEAFSLAAEIMRDLQQQAHPDLSAQVAEVEQAAQAFDPDGLLLEQQQEVAAYFDRADEALQAMARRPA